MQNSPTESGPKGSQQISFNQSAALHPSQETWWMLRVGNPRLPPRSTAKKGSPKKLFFVELYKCGKLRAQKWVQCHSGFHPIGRNLSM
jgi:hypothetical protein